MKSECELLKKKYYCASLLTALVLIGSHFFLNYAYEYFLSFPPLVSFTLSIQSLIGYVLFAFAFSYIHERIPACASPHYEKILRYGGMIFVFVFSLMLFIYPLSSLWTLFYIADFALIFSFVAAVPCVLTLYRFSPGKEVHKSGVCAPR